MKFLHLVFLISLKLNGILCNKVSEVFYEQNEKEIDSSDPSIYLFFYKFIGSVECLSFCLNLTECKFAAFNSTLCILYSINAGSYFIPKKTLKLYSKNKFVYGLIHYWPIENQLTNDVIKSKNLFNPSNMNFTVDRFGRPNSALSFTYGFIQAPADIYFGNVFTVLAWVRLKECIQYQKLIDFGNENTNQDRIAIALNNFNCEINFSTFITDINNPHQIEYNGLTLFNWHHVGFVAEERRLKIYINGTMIVQTPEYASFSARPVQRNNCFIGRSIDPNLKPSNADYDDIKIFSIPLTAYEIKSQYENII